MKKAPKIIVLLLVVVSTIPMHNSCKKGEGDPFISLKSREGRLKGEWKLVSGAETTTTGSTTFTVTYTDNSSTYVNGGFTQTFTYSEKIEFLEENIFKSTIIKDDEIETSEGFWAFMDGYDDYANKEMLVIRLKSVTSEGTIRTYTGDRMPIIILRFNKLSNKEYIIESEGTSSTGNSSSSKTYQKN